MNFVLKKFYDSFHSFSVTILVHGDTTTTFSASLASFYLKIPVGHVEAGLRTHNIYSPFPEEINRKLTTSIAGYHFAPTVWAKQNLLKENVPEENILVTGNTVIDALHRGLELVKSSGKTFIFEKFNGKRVVLVTGHRRENFGEGFLNIFLEGLAGSTGAMPLKCPCGQRINSGRDPN